MMKNYLFTGAATALVTPFLDGAVNYPLLEQLLRRQVEAGIEAVVIAGTTGESPTLTDDEKLELFSRAKEYVGDSCKIIAGTGSNSTVHTISLSMAAEERGVDALLVVTPYYNKATPEGLFAHFASVAHSVSIPIILYNVPSRTGVDIPVKVYRRLSQIPNIIGIKEASTDVSKVTKILRACGPDFAVWSGNDELITPVMAMGGKGSITACDVYEHKAQLIQKGAARLGIEGLQAMEQDASQQNPQWIGKMDAVIADVPCSGYGIIRKKPDIRYKDPDGMKELPQLQLAILKNQASYVKPGGVLMYSTCTLVRRENEGVVEKFLKENPEFTKENLNLPDIFPKNETGMFTFVPGEFDTDGFFVCRLRRKL